MAINTALFANPQIGAAYQNDPRLGYAQALLQNGSSTAPVLSPGEAVARALQAPLGGLMASRLRGGYQAQDQQYRAGLAAALKGDDPVTALSNSADPTLQQMGLEQQLSLGQARAKAKIDLQNQLMGQGKMLAPDGSVTAVPGFGAATGQTANESTMAQISGDVAKQNALIPGQVSGAVQQAQALIPVNAQGAAANAAATMPYDVAKAQTVYNTTQGPQNKQNNIEKIRDDVRGDMNIKNYQTVQPIMESIKQAATTDSRAANLNMIYGFAKIMDPNSVVREGEQVLVQGTGALQDQLAGLLSKIQGGQPLTPETRQQLIAAAQSRVDQLKGVYDQAQNYYATAAQSIGAKPSDVLYQLPLATGPGTTLNFDSNGNRVQ